MEQTGTEQMATNKEQTDNLDNTVQPGDLGKLLVNYREIAHLDVEQMADALCLTSSTVLALENESFDKLPEAPYVRGYLRNYAKLANEDPQHILHVYNTLSGEPSREELVSKLAAPTNYHEVANPIITPQRFRLGLLAAALLLLALLSMTPGIREWISGLWSNFSSPSDITADADSSSGTPASLLSGNLPGNLPITPETTQSSNTKSSAENSTAESSSNDSHATDQDTTDSTEVEPVAETTENGSTDESTPAEQEDNNVATETDTPSNDSSDAAPTDTETENTAPEEGNTKLKLVFSQEVWLRIKDTNGKTVYEALNPAGTEKELSLTSPLKFKVGNAPGLTLYVNGEAMDISPFTKGSVANFGIE